MNDPCYELIAHRVSSADWRTFAAGLSRGFEGFPSAWALDDALRGQLAFRVKWRYFNPDLEEDREKKNRIAAAYARSFLGDGFWRKFTFLRQRSQGEQRDHWDRELAQFERLLSLSAMSESERLDWLARLDARLRYGATRRARVIKNRGLGLFSELLGVEPQMEWGDIKARYRALVMEHHPDKGGDPARAQAVIEEFQRLRRAATV